MGRRRQAREIALQALYVADVSGTAPDDAFAIVIRRAAPPDEKTLDFARGLVRGAWENRSGIDRRLQEVAQNWTVARMAAVDRNILRLAAFELTQRPDTPAGVVIDEAIEIARKYSTEDATKFVNGVLDKIKSDGAPKNPG